MSVRVLVHVFVVSAHLVTAASCGTERPKPAAPVTTKHQTPKRDTADRLPHESLWLEPKPTAPSRGEPPPWLPGAAKKALEAAESKNNGRYVFTKRQVAAIVAYAERRLECKGKRHGWEWDPSVPTRLSLFQKDCRDTEFLGPNAAFRVDYCRTCAQDVDGDGVREYWFMFDYSPGGNSGGPELHLLDQDSEGHIRVVPMIFDCPCAKGLETKMDPVPQLIGAAGDRVTVECCCNRPAACHGCCHFTYRVRFQYHRGKLVRPVVLSVRPNP